MSGYNTVEWEEGGFFKIHLFRPPFFLTKECGPVELSIKDVYMANDDQSNQQAQPAQFSC